MARRRWGKILGIILLVLVVVISLGITFTIGWRPLIGARKRALTDRKFESTEARLLRGKYLDEAAREMVELIGLGNMAMERSGVELGQ